MVIHLAAIDIGVPAEPEAYFGTNVMGTWNAVQAAREAGVRKVVLASSISAVGVGEMRPDFPPEYLPVDEAHAMKPAHAYGASKLVVEDIARAFALEGDMSITCLRPVAVIVESNLRRAIERAEDPRHPWLAGLRHRRGHGPRLRSRARLRRAIRRDVHRRRRFGFDGADAEAARGRVRRRSAGSGSGVVSSATLRLAHRRDPCEAAPAVAADLDLGGGGGGARCVLRYPG